jgi:hypothetical protein
VELLDEEFDGEVLAIPVTSTTSGWGILKGEKTLEFRV